MSDLTIDDVAYPVKAFTLTTNVPPIRPVPSLPLGRFEVTGTMTAYFTNEALLAAIIARPHKEAAWRVLRPRLYRVAAYAVLGALVSFILISGAY